MTAFLAQTAPNYSGAVLIWLVLLLGLALIPANIASKKGRSAVGFYVFGVLFFLPALIVALLMPRKTPSAAAWGGQPVNFGITWIDTGNRYMLGHAIEDHYYGIWDGQEPGPALMTFPFTEQGEADAIARFHQLEPGSRVTAREPGGLPAPPPMPAG